MRAWSYGVGAIVIWCLIPVGVKEGATSLDWSWLLLLRFLGSMFVFIPWIIRAKPFWTKEPRLALWGMALLGLNYGLQTLAILELKVSTYALAFGLAPLICAITCRTQTWTRLSLLGAALSILGAWTAIGSDEITIGSSHYPAVAVACLFGGIATWSLLTRWMIAVQKRGLGSIELTSSMQAFALIGVTPLWIWRGCPTILPVKSQIAPLALFAIGVPLAFWLYAHALRTNPRVGVTAQYLEPIIGCAVGALFLSETLGLQHLAATALILTGIALQTGS